MFCSNISLLNFTAAIINTYFAGSVFAFYGAVAIGVIAIASLVSISVGAYKKHKGKSKRNVLSAKKEKGQKQNITQTQQAQVNNQIKSKGKIFENARNGENDINPDEDLVTGKIEPQPIIKNNDKKEPIVIAAQGKDKIDSDLVLESTLSDGKEL